MTAPDRLVELLDTLPPEERRELTVWLLTRTTGQPREHTWLSGAGLRRPTAATLTPPGEETQLVTIRLPSESHANLRAWCNEHGFTMAAVVRGLVERFLEEQQASTQAPPADAEEHTPPAA